MFMKLTGVSADLRCVRKHEEGARSAVRLVGLSFWRGIEHVHSSQKISKAKVEKPFGVVEISEYDW